MVGLERYGGSALCRHLWFFMREAGCLLAFVIFSIPGHGADCPNFLVITADDLGCQLGCYGEAQAKTPNIDKLAGEGIRFEDGYITQSSCSPSRSSILTGLYPHENGQIGLANQGFKMKPGVPLLPNLLKEHGYRTGILGKLHVGTTGEEMQFDFKWASDNNPVLTRDVRTVAAKAAEFFAQSGETPFFLYVNYFDPHQPYEAGANQTEGLPEAVLKAGEVRPMSWLGIENPPQILGELASYYNCVHRLDAGIGFLMEALEKAGKTEKTLVIFLGDNGPPFARAKTTCYDPGLRIPFLVRWPGVIASGRVSDALVCGVDIPPTLLAAAGFSADASRMSGKSLLPVFEGKGSVREWLPMEYTFHAAGHFYPRRAVRAGAFLYIENLLPDRENPVVPLPWAMPPPGHPMHAAHATMKRPPRIELYDVKKDPDCLVNLAAEPPFAADVERLGNVLARWRESSRDPLSNPETLRAMTEENDAAVMKQKAGEASLSGRSD